MKIQTDHFGDVTLVNFKDLSKDDLRYVLKMRNHPEIKKWMYNQEDIIEDQHFSYIEFLKNDVTKQYFLVKQPGLVIGSINFTNIDCLNSSADFGLYANPLEFISGAGRILEETAMSYAKEQLKLSVLNLEVFESNQRAFNFYIKNGFQQTGNRDVKGQAVICMQKIIKESE